MTTKKTKPWDVIIIGAGPAGMFAANELADTGNSVLIIDMGKDVDKRICPSEYDMGCTECKPCNIMCGVGGAGTLSGGRLNLRPDIGGDLTEVTKDNDLAWELVDYVDKVFLEHGGPKKLYKPKGKGLENLSRSAAAAGIKFIEIPQRHIGSDKSPKVIQAFEDDLKERGVVFRLNTKVTDLIIRKGECLGVITKKKERIRSRFTIMAPGRIGGPWVEELVRKRDITARFGPIDVGVRIEVPAIIMTPVTDINMDPKFHIHTKRYDDFVRTFCTNARGFVVKEWYDGFIGVNGHSMIKKASRNTNFALLVRIQLTEPVENTTQYGKSIAELATTIGGGKPIIQRMGDLRRGRRSSWDRIRKNHVKNTLKDVTPGDISMALPHRVVMDIIEGLEKLNEIIPGVAADSTLIYAPEIKFYAMQVKVNERMETSVKNLFAAGDGVGLSGDIINAAATGVLAGRGVMNSIEST
ncbi:MAG: NAD(P)/FAD-dependent oxidoreductase [Methanomassiliicoccales archaeon]|nr:MAG: NAD(P)/FAD-dependent oxidoreductase [Methanomassiliicoccales archaeon]